MKAHSLSIILISLLFLGCGSSGNNENDNSNPDVTTPLESTLLNGNIPEITPSTQTSDEIIQVVTYTNNYQELESIDPEIKISRGYGSYHFGVDANDKSVVITQTRKTGYGPKNIFMCHEADGLCSKIVDNSGDSNVATVSAYSSGKIFLNTLHRYTDPKAGAYGSAVDIYDIATKTYTQNAFSHIGLNGETRTITLGSDGFIYLGGVNAKSSKKYPSSLRLNPNDLTDYTFYEDYWLDESVDRARSIGADNTHTYQVVGDDPFKLIALNRATGVSTNLHQSKNGIIRQLKDGVAYNYYEDGVLKYAYLFNGEYYPVPQDAQAPWYDPLVHQPNHQGGYWPWKEYYQVGHSGVSKPAISGSGSLNVVTQDINGDINSSFTITINGTDITTFNMSPDIYKQSTKLIKKIDNYLLIAGNTYTGTSKYNLDTGVSNYLGAHNISQGIISPIYNYSTSRNEVLISGYPSTKFAIYNPFNEFSSDNFKYIDNVYARNWTDINDPTQNLEIHRPLGSKSIQIDEDVYVIGHRYRDGNDGALGWYNTATGETAGIRVGIFENYQTRSMTKIGNYIAIATQTVDNLETQRESRPDNSKIFLFDPKTKKIINEFSPVINFGARDSGRIATIDNRHIIGITNDMLQNGSSNSASKTYLYILDMYTGDLVMEKTINYKNQMIIQNNGTAQIDGFDFKVYNGYIYTWLGDRDLVRIDKNGFIEKIGTMPYKGRLEFFNDEIFISGGVDIIHIKNLL